MQTEMQSPSVTAMSTAANDFPYPDSHYPGSEGTEFQPYRAVNRSAVMAAVLAGLSLLALVFPTLLVLPIVGLVLGISAIATIRRYPTEYTGLGLAKVAAVVCALLFVGGASLHAYTYATEVPEGYVRIGFWDLQPDPDHPDLPVSPKSLELSGKQIFIKGYMHPGVAGFGKVNHFILVPDMGTCCFGGQPKATDMVEVYVPEGKNRIAYSTRRIKLAGTFAVSQEPSDSLGLNNVWYHLKVDEVR